MNRPQAESSHAMTWTGVSARITTSGTQGSGSAWRPTVHLTIPPSVDAAQVALASPQNSQLIHWAGTPSSQPPQQWFDDDSDPFAADAK
jgi:hypothetical protein